MGREENTVCVWGGGKHYVGRHNERHTGSVIRARDVPDSRRSSRGGSRKEKIALSQSYLFVPIAAETMGAISKDGMDFLCELGRRITQYTDNHRESALLCQRLSVLIQRYNAVAVLGTFPHTTPENEM